MKKVLALVVLFMFAAVSMSFAAEAAKETKAKDPVTATAEVAGKTVEAAGEVVVAPVKAMTGTKETKKAEKAAK